MAAKKTTRRKTAAKPAALPKGFTAIGGFGKTFPDLNDPKKSTDTKPGEAITGVVTGYRENIKTQHGTTSNMSIETKDGENFTVWESAGLAILFEEDYTDVEIWLRFDGLGRKKGKKNPPKLFTLAVNDK